MAHRDKLLHLLSTHPELRHTVTDQAITVHPPTPTAFTATLTTRPGWTVSFDGWHEDFAREEDAYDCFAMGLSDQCRLKVVRRGHHDCSWTLEYRDGDAWVEDSTVGLIFIPFWRRPQTLYRQIAVLRRRPDSQPPPPHSS